MKPFSLKEYIKNPKKVVTRDGRAVKIYCTDYIDSDSGPVIAKIEGDTYSNSFREDGRYVDYEETNNNPIFAPETRNKSINNFKIYDYEEVYHSTCSNVQLWTIQLRPLGRSAEQ